MQIKYRLDISDEFEKFTYQYFSSLCDASYCESRYKSKGFKVTMQFYDYRTGEWN